MAIAETVNKLPLDTWFKIMGINPLHANQVRLSTESATICDQIIFQHSWQNSDHVSREEIAIAIAEAEEKIERFLGYRLAPSWEVDEWRPTSRPYTSEYVTLNGSDIRGYKQTVRADWGYLISGGIQSKELISAAASVSYTDLNSDGYAETATVIVATSVVDKNEICIFYPGHSGEDRWEIRPINVVISGGNATITFRREQAVKEEFFDVIDREDLEGVDGLVDNNFLTTVDVYRRYNDPQTQASFLWEPLGDWCSDCGGSGCATCAYGIQSGCLILRGDPRNSIVGFSPGSWDNALDNFVGAPWAVSRLPDIVRLYYYAGYRDKRQNYVSRMSSDWERTVAYMAAAFLDRPACDCSADTWNHWRADFALSNGDPDGTPTFRTPAGADRELDILNNPFGTRRGEIYAWNKVKSLAVYDAVNLRV